MKTKFNIGDKVKIVGYGHLAFFLSIHALNKWYNHFKKSEEEIWFKIFFPNEPIPKYIDQDFSHKAYKEYDNMVSVDVSPDLVGQIGIVTDAHKTQGKDTYAIEGINGKHAWYHNEQLEMINKNPNYE